MYEILIKHKHRYKYNNSLDVKKLFTLRLLVAKGVC